jgi:tRNA A37 N6-isopentenylltransferase MiaA
MNPQEYKKIIVILGPTASGKSDLAIALAKKVAVKANLILNFLSIIEF